MVTWGQAVHHCLSASEALAAEGVTVDLIDLRWINPLDFDAVLASLERTTRLMVVHEANLTAGFGAEVAARAASEGFWTLDAPVVRVGAPDIRVPAAPSLQAEVLVNPDRIVQAAYRLLHGDVRDGND